ncbi:MAG: ABC transporter substrate-binding protein, partial [Gemmatimonadales bacterium]
VDRMLRETMMEHGSAYRVDLEAVARLAPDLILSQAVCEVCAVPTSLAEQAARATNRPTQVISLDAHSVGDVLQSIMTVGVAAGVKDTARELVARLSARLESVREAVNGAVRPSVLALEWLDPPFVPGHWVPEMIETAGGRLLMGEAGRPSVQVDWESLGGLDPDFLLVMPCGYDLETAQSDAARGAVHLLRVAPRAVEAGAAWILDGSAYFNRSGPRMVDGVEILSAILHGERFRGTELEGKAQRWAGGD